MPASHLTRDHPVIVREPTREFAAEGLAEVAASALGKLIVDWVVLPEEWDELSPAVQRELLALGDTDRLLARLGELQLLTPSRPRPSATGWRTTWSSASAECWT